MLSSKTNGPGHISLKYEGFALVFWMWIKLFKQSFTLSPPGLPHFQNKIKMEMKSAK